MTLVKLGRTMMYFKLHPKIHPKLFPNFFFAYSDYSGLQLIFLDVPTVVLPRSFHHRQRRLTSFQLDLTFLDVTCSIFLIFWWDKKRRQQKIQWISGWPNVEDKLEPLGL